MFLLRSIIGSVAALAMPVILTAEMDPATKDRLKGVADDDKFRSLKMLAKQRRDGVVGVYQLDEEPVGEVLDALVAQWPPERIAGLREKTQLPVTRIIALLGISQPGFSRLSLGDFSPSPALCRRMQGLEDLAARGELHAQIVPKTAEFQRRMALFRAWFLAKPATVDFPIVECRMTVQWGRGSHERIVLPIEHMPALRLKNLSALTEVVKAVTIALRRMALGNAKSLWKDIDAAFWQAYSRDTLPKIVLERAKIPTKASQARKKATCPEDNLSPSNGINSPVQS